MSQRIEIQIRTACCLCSGRGVIVLQDNPATPCPICKGAGWEYSWATLHDLVANFSERVVEMILGDKQISRVMAPVLGAMAGVSISPSLQKRRRTRRAPITVMEDAIKEKEQNDRPENDRDEA